MKETDDEGRRAIPNSILHELREGLFIGRAAAEARLELAKGRHGDILDQLLGDSGRQLFFEENGKHATRFLDALDLVDFWTEVRP